MRILQGTLAQQIHDSAARKSIVGIGRSLETMTDMLTSLLDINQLEAGNLRPSTSDFSVSDILDDAGCRFLSNPQRKRACDGDWFAPGLRSIATDACSRK